MRPANLISCSRTLLIRINPMSRLGNELLFAIAFFVIDGCQGHLERQEAIIPAKLPDAAYGPKGETLVPLQLQGLPGELQWETNYFHTGKPARGSIA
jgi:hypothetical protein